MVDGGIDCTYLVSLPQDCPSTINDPIGIPMSPHADPICCNSVVHPFALDKLLMDLYGFAIPVLVIYASLPSLVFIFFPEYCDPDI